LLDGEKLRVSESTRQQIQEAEHREFGPGKLGVVLQQDGFVVWTMKRTEDRNAMETSYDPSEEIGSEEMRMDQVNRLSLEQPQQANEAQGQAVNGPKPQADDRVSELSNRLVPEFIPIVEIHDDPVESPSIQPGEIRIEESFRSARTQIFDQMQNAEGLCHATVYGAR
jgi:hypothetical protein